ncbi:MAG: glutamate ligase domain-containing protein, partial [Nitriliruptoraceae bacterium]
YAHTPEAVTTVVATVRESLPAGGRLLLVLGCGGDRDHSKRGPMGAAATAADVAVLTSDNPRSEDPGANLAAMVDGASAALEAGATASVVVEPDRRRAIGLALAKARADDVVLIAGKGHESVQELADRVVPFDDREVAATFLTGAEERP